MKTDKELEEMGWGRQRKRKPRPKYRLHNEKQPNHDLYVYDRKYDFKKMSRKQMLERAKETCGNDIAYNERMESIKNLPHQRRWHKPYLVARNCYLLIITMSLLLSFPNIDLFSLLSFAFFFAIGIFAKKLCEV